MRKDEMVSNASAARDAAAELAAVPRRPRTAYGDGSAATGWRLSVL